MVFEPDINSNPFGRAHPVLIVGILVYLASFFVTWVPGFIGIILIIIGSIISVYDLSQR